MPGRAPLMEDLRRFKESVNREFPVERIILFGSMATGRSRKDSDIDLIIVSNAFRKLNFIRRAARMYDHWTLDYPVDFLCYTPEEFRSLAGRITIVRQAAKTGVAV